MIFFVMMIGLLNLGLGFVLAVYLDHRLLVARRWPAGVAGAASSPVTLTPKMRPSTTAGTTPATDAESAGKKWRAILKRPPADVKLLIEAVAGFDSAQIDDYETKLIEIDDLVQRRTERMESVQLCVWAKQLRDANLAWLDQQQELAERLGDESLKSGPLARATAFLKQTLDKLTASIEQFAAGTDSFDSENETGGGVRLDRELKTLAAQVHQLRGQLAETWAAIGQATNAVEGMPRELAVDSLTSLPNRVALEQIVYVWQQADPNQQRLASAALLDVDQMAALNSACGLRIGDEFLEASGKHLEALVRNGRMHDQVVRLSGATFGVFFGDTGPRNATSATERLRQSIEHTTFRVGDDEHHVTVSCGVTRIGGGDRVTDIVDRLHLSVDTAKQAGGNRTAMNEGDGPRIVQPPKFQIRRHSIEVSGVRKSRIGTART